MKTLRKRFRHGDPVAPLRREVARLLASWCPPEYVEDTLLVISELVQNVTQHTAGDGELVVRVAASEIVVEVRDGDRALPRPQPPDHRRPGGRGLLLVAGVAREWGSRAEPDGKVVWAHIPTPAAACGDAAA